MNSLAISTLQQNVKFDTCLCYRNMLENYCDKLSTCVCECVWSDLYKKCGHQIVVWSMNQFIPSTLMLS